MWHQVSTSITCAWDWTEVSGSLRSAAISEMGQAVSSLAYHFACLFRCIAQNAASKLFSTNALAARGQTRGLRAVDIGICPIMGGFAKGNACRIHWLLVLMPLTKGNLRGEGAVRAIPSPARALAAPKSTLGAGRARQSRTGRYGR